MHKNGYVSVTVKTIFETSHVEPIIFLYLSSSLCQSTKTFILDTSVTYACYPTNKIPQRKIINWGVISRLNFILSPQIKRKQHM